MGTGVKATYFIVDDATGGDCDGGSGPIGTWDDTNNVCTLTQDLTESISIDSSNIELDCDGYSISVCDPGHSCIYAADVTDITIDGCTISNAEVDGIYLSRSSYCTIQNCNILSSVDDGISLVNSSDNTLFNNVIQNSGGEGILVYREADDNLIFQNDISNNAGHGIYLYEADYNILLDNTVDQSTFDKNAIRLYNSMDTIIDSNTITTEKAQICHGIRLGSSSHYNTVINNQINTHYLQGYGVVISSSYYNNVTQNNITTEGRSSYGMILWGSDYNDITNNQITTINDSAYGMSLLKMTINNNPYGCDYNLIQENTIETSGQYAYGLMLHNMSSYNDVYSNYITTNGPDAYGMEAFYAWNNRLWANEITTTGDGGYGYVAYHASSNDFSNNNVNTYGNYQSGYLSYGSSHDNTVENNYFYSDAYSGAGIYLYYSPYYNIYKSNYITCTGPFNYGFYVRSGFDNYFIDNYITTYNKGFAFYENSDYNYIYNNKLFNNYRGGVYFSSDSNFNNLTGNFICDNGFDINDSGNNYGDNNVCDTPYTWNDFAKLGCTYSCDQVHNYTIEFDTGWNLFSIPLLFSNMSTSFLFSTMLGNYKNIFTYTDEWIQLDNDSDINLSYGYWMDMNFPDTLELDFGILPDKIYYDIHEGWNLFSYPSMNANDADYTFDWITDWYKWGYTYSDSWWYFHDPFTLHTDTLNTGDAIYGESLENTTWIYDSRNDRFICIDDIPRPATNFTERVLCGNFSVYSQFHRALYELPLNNISQFLDPAWGNTSCAPTSAAAIFDYLNTTYPNMTDGYSTTELVQACRLAMNTPINNGTPFVNILTGIMKFLNTSGYANNFSVNMYHNWDYTIGGVDINGSKSHHYRGVNYTIIEKRPTESDIFQEVFVNNGFAVMSFTHDVIANFSHMVALSDFHHLPNADGSYNISWMCPSYARMIYTNIRNGSIDMPGGTATLRSLYAISPKN